jgi:hypothetical protein
LKRVAKWEAGASDDHAWVWERDGWDDSGVGWLLSRWNGFDVDYGSVVRGFDLPDGSRTGFWRDYNADSSVKEILASATWWSARMMPEWLEKRGVKYASDEFSQQRILGLAKNDEFGGWHYQRPAWFPVVLREATDER